MPHIKELLISPFSLVPPTNAANATKKKAPQRPFQPCKCDSDNEDNDFGMAPDCAFICSLAQRNKTKKRKQLPRKKTRKNRHLHAS
jgi:hypothetical protein